MTIKRACIMLLLSSNSALLAAESEVVESHKDLNKDGVQDIFYEYEEAGYYELRDANFDGKIDVSAYFLNDDSIVSSRHDEDYDGRLESTTLFKKGNAELSWVDTDGDNLAEIIFYYDEGILVKAEKYYPSSTIGLVKFKYGYPLGESIEKTKLTKAEFHSARIDKKY